VRATVERGNAVEPTAGCWRDWVGPGFVLVLLSLVAFAVPFPGSDSGTLDVYPTEGLVVLLGGALLTLLISRRWRPAAVTQRLILVLAVFLAWYVVVTVVRYLAGEEVKQSALAMRTTVLPLVCYALLDIGWERPMRVVRSMVLLNLGISLVHLPAWQNMRMSDYLGNSMVYGALLVMLIPLNVYVIAVTSSSRSDLALKLVALINLVFALVMPVWTGSRSLTILCWLVLVVSAAFLVRRTLVWIALGVVVLGALAAHTAVWVTNPGGAAFGVYRVVPPPALQGPEAEVQAVTVSEKQKADSERAVLQRQSIDEIKEDPIFTDGRLYFPFESDFGETQASPHDFVLEHIDAYGVVGFALYLALFGVVLWPGCLRLRMRQPGAAENVCAWLTLGTTMGFSLAQPTMLIFTIVMPMWLVLAAMKHRQAEMTAPEAEATV
jgi:hypothetical protein